MSIAVISHPDCLLHCMGEEHPERPSRVRVIQSALKQYPFTTPVTYYEAPKISEKELLLAHTMAHIKGMQSRVLPGHLRMIDEDTGMNEYTYQGAQRAAGAGIFAVDLLMQGKHQVAFCNVRPPGHHAEVEKAMGFCFFNNIAIAAKYSLKQYHLTRVAIIDFDAHHGNGTQSIFQDDSRVMLCSSFEHPFYPGYIPANDNAHILNLPLAAGTDGKIYREKITDVWLPALNEFKPELIFFSAGFDSHTKDPLANIQLEKEDYVWLTENMAIIAGRYAKGRMISMLEGGYHPRVLAECVPAHVNAMISPE